VPAEIGSSAARPEALESLGLASALANLSERITRRTGITIERRIERDLHLDDDVSVAIYRIAQESLTSAVRHAGAATCPRRSTRPPVSISATLHRH
jgi:two-component system sensor histidine kinase UhpB